MQPVTRDTQAQVRLIEEARDCLERDARIAACWLEGSFAAGTADAWSDVDLHVAVAEENWTAVLEERRALVERIRPILGAVEATLPWGAYVVSATVRGPVRIDLFVEKLSGLPTAARREQPQVLFDRAEAASSLRINWNPEMVAGVTLRQLLSTFFFGAMWPVRLAGRGERGTMIMNATSVVFQFLVPAILLQEGGDNFFRPHYHNERFLAPDRRRYIDDLLSEIIDAFGGAESASSDGAIARVHARLIGAAFRELRLASEKYAIEYPASAEFEYREYYMRELGLEIDG